MRLRARFLASCGSNERTDTGVVNVAACEIQVLDAVCGGRAELRGQSARARVLHAMPPQPERRAVARQDLGYLVVDLLLRSHDVMHRTSCPIYSSYPSMTGSLLL